MTRYVVGACIDERGRASGGKAGDQTGREVCVHTLASSGAWSRILRPPRNASVIVKQAYAMVAYYGMSSAMPNVCYYDSTGQEYSFSKPFSEERAKVIDQEISKIIAEQYQRAKELLILHQDGHNRLAQTLEEREVIFTEDVEQIFGPRPWTSRTDELLKESEVTEQKPAEAPAKNNTNQ